MHQDLRVVVRIIQSRADARSPGEQRAAEGDKQSRSDHGAELGLLPPRPGRGRRVARALHHAGRGRGPVIGAALGRGPHGSTLGRRFAQVHASCKNGTRGSSSAAVRPSRDGSGADGSRRRPVGRVIFLFQTIRVVAFLSQCLGSKSVLLHRILGEIRDLGCPTAPSGLQGKAEAQDQAAVRKVPPRPRANDAR